MFALDTLPQWAAYTIVGLCSVLAVVIVFMLLCALQYCHRRGRKAKDLPHAAHAHTTRARPSPHPVKALTRRNQQVEPEDEPPGPLDFEDSYSYHEPRNLIAEARQKRHDLLEPPEHVVVLHSPVSPPLPDYDATYMKLWWTNSELEARNKRLTAELAELRREVETGGGFLASLDADREADEEWAAAELAYAEAARRLELAKHAPARSMPQAERAPDRAWIGENRCCYDATYDALRPSTRSSPSRSSEPRSLYSPKPPPSLERLHSPKGTPNRAEKRWAMASRV